MLARPSALALASLLVLTAAAPADVTLTGKECRIKTDLKPKEAKEVPGRIDRYCANFASFYDELGLKPRASNKVVIRLFARYEDYEEFFKRTASGLDSPAAYFSPSLNGVVSYHDPDNPYLRQVLFHETSHQYMNRYTSSAPKWLNEGLAEYFEGWQLAPDGSLIERRPPFYDLLVVQAALAEGSEHLPIRELIEMPPQRFNEFRTHYPDLDGYLHYSTAWALTWYFIEGPNEEDRERYLTYFRGLCEDGDRAAPFAPQDWDGWEALEERWKAYVLAIEVEPKNADDHLILAANLRDEGDLEGAQKHYQKVLELAPNTPDVRYWLGYCCKRQGDYDGARPHLLAAMKDDPKNPRPVYLLARIESGLDQKEPASQDFVLALGLAEKASALVDDESPQYLSFVARLQHETGDPKAAGKTMKKVLKLVKDEDPEIVAMYEELAEELSK